jgi:uroporphyrinogen-III synthase
MIPLEGRRVLVTRAEDDARRWADQLRAWGAEPEVLPCLSCRLREDPATREALAGALDGAHWLSVSSRRGVEAVAALTRASQRAPLRIAAVGETTARSCREQLDRVDLVAPGGTGRALAETLAGALAPNVAAGGRPIVVAAAGDRAPQELERVLEPMGVEVRRVVVYETVPAAPRDPKVDLAESGIEIVLLASPSAVQGLAAQAVILPSTKLISIGPSTSEAIRDAGWEVAGEASRRDLVGLVEAIR